MKNRQSQYHNQIIFCFIVFLLSSFFIGEYIIAEDGSVQTMANSNIIERKQKNAEPDSSVNNVKEDKKEGVNINSKTNTDSNSNTVSNKESKNTANSPNETKQTDAIEKETNENETNVNDKNQVSLIALGDNLIHIEVYKSGKKTNGSLNYDALYKNLKDDIKNADLAVINQETILGNKEFGYTGYPNFCSPKEIGNALTKAGFDVILQATNHAMDRGVKAIDYTIDFWEKQKGITLLGLNDSKKERSNIDVIEKNGIKFAMLNYTYSLNGHAMPKDQNYLVNELDEEKVTSDIKKAKKMADVVIVFPHWGKEYSYKPNDLQIHYTKLFADLGVDLVIGTHPHVLQPVEWVEGKDEHKMLVYYSLGNYVSYQREAPRMLGGMAKVTFEKDDEGVQIKTASIIPIVTHYENKNGYKFYVYKLKEYTEELAKRHGILKLEKNSVFTLSNLKKLGKDILGDWYQEE